MGGPSPKSQLRKQQKIERWQAIANPNLAKAKAGNYTPINLETLKQPYAYGGDELRSAYDQARASGQLYGGPRSSFQRFALDHQLAGARALANAGILSPFAGTPSSGDEISYYESQLASFDPNRLTPDVVARAGGKEAVYKAFEYSAQGLKNIADKRARRLPTKIGGAIISGIVGSALFGPAGYPGAFAAGATSSIGTGEDPIMAGTRALAAKGLGDLSVKGVKKLGDKVSLGLKGPNKLADPLAGIGDKPKLKLSSLGSSSNTNPSSLGGVADQGFSYGHFDLTQGHVTSGTLAAQAGSALRGATPGLVAAGASAGSSAYGKFKGGLKKVGKFLSSPTARLGASLVASNLGYTAQEYARKQAGTAGAIGGALNAAARVPEARTTTGPTPGEADSRSKRKRGLLGARQALLINRNLRADTTKRYIGLRF